MSCDCEACTKDKRDHSLLYTEVRTGLALIGVPLPAVPVQLGKGVYAKAYATDDGRVAKITGDLTERYAAMLAMRSPQRHLVRVDAVYKVDDRYTVTVVERLQPLSTLQRKQWGQTPEMDKVYAAIQADAKAVGITSLTDLHYQNVMVRPSTGDIVASDLGVSRSSEQPEPPPIPRPGIDDGDPGDVDVPRPAPPKPDPRAVAWDFAVRQAKAGDKYLVVKEFPERGEVWLELGPQAKTPAPLPGVDPWYARPAIREFRMAPPGRGGKEKRLAELDRWWRMDALPMQQIPRPKPEPAPDDPRRKDFLEAKVGEARKELERIYEREWARNLRYDVKPMIFRDLIPKDKPSVMLPEKPKPPPEPAHVHVVKTDPEAPG